MHEENLDVSRNIVKSATQKMVDDADAVVVMCDLDDCPKFLLDSRKFKHIPIPDPYGISVEYTRTVRDEIKRMSWICCILINFIKSHPFLEYVKYE